MTRGRLVTLVLFGLSGFLLVAAVLLPTFTAGQLAKTPLDLEITTVATTDDSGAELVDPRSTSGDGAITTTKRVPLVMQRFITVEDPADRNVATLQSGQTMRRTDRQGDTGLLTALVDRVTIDRKTAMPTDPTGALQDNGLKAPRELTHTGLGYRFPIGTKKTSYPYFDLTARRSYDLEFVEETDIAGTAVYHFHQKIAPVDLSGAEMKKRDPGGVVEPATFTATKWGLNGGDTKITMPQWYSNERDLWVEPKTGTIVKAQEKIDNFYGRSANEATLTILKANLTFDESTIETLLTTANDFSDRLTFYSRILPVLFGIGGIAALAAAVVMVARVNRDDDEDGVAPFDDEPEWSTQVSPPPPPIEPHNPWSTNPFRPPNPPPLPPR